MKNPKEITLEKLNEFKDKVEQSDCFLRSDWRETINADTTIRLEITIEVFQ